MTTPTPVPHHPSHTDWMEIDTSTETKVLTWTEMDTSTEEPDAPSPRLNGPLHDLIEHAMKQMRLKTPNDFRRYARLSCSEFARLSSPARPGPAPPPWSGSLWP